MSPMEAVWRPELATGISCVKSVSDLALAGAMLVCAGSGRRAAQTCSWRVVNREWLDGGSIRSPRIFTIPMMVGAFFGWKNQRLRAHSKRWSGTVYWGCSLGFDPPRNRRFPSVKVMFDPLARFSPFLAW